MCATAPLSQVEELEFVSVGICPSCLVCQDTWNMPEDELQTAWTDCTVNDEGGFSWSPCEGCGSTLGGNRYAAHGRTPDGTLIHFDVCGDCLEAA